MTAGAAKKRELVVVSGYYGFDNLGDEAILEELTHELKQLWPADKIVVLSANPEKTRRLFGVQSQDRMDIASLMSLCKQARLFISGGGGLFQNTRTLGSVVYYTFQMLLAKALGAGVAVYAQGIGPLNGKLAHFLTKQAFSAADAVAVRDEGSRKLLEQWQIQCAQTADPVWCLDPKPLPDSVAQQINAIAATRLIGLSLRPSHNFADQHLLVLAKAMAEAVPPSAHLLLLPLQVQQDKEVLVRFQSQWSRLGRASTLIDTSSLELPAQWIALFGRCKLVVAMRLHALIMALKAGVGVVGIAYDPKVSHLLSEFEQPALRLDKEPSQDEWNQILAGGIADADKLARRAMKKAEGAKKLACQNFNLLARMLNAQKIS
jgi:polysaccharide pyruvyl transferase CsaB